MPQDSNSTKSPATSAGLSFDDDCIFALASGRLPSAVAVVRVSGRDCLEKLRQVVHLAENKWAKFRQMHLCSVIDAESGKNNKE